ncbi:MAG: glucuronate isomerase [Roseibacillus sp.]|nr:glucuronate isomerase [Roseibacillus sp.]
MARAFLDDNFLLHSKTAEHLYHEVAAVQPIIDYHTHLPPQEVAENQRWENITALWLSEDHYKWRAMRANGIPETHITGNASPRDKFQAWSQTIPNTIGNPLFHWTHLELRRCFGIDTLLNPDTAEEVWNAANERIAEKDFCAHGLLERFKVDTVGTTDDPSDSLAHHEACAALDLETKIYPTFRPDKAFMIDRPHILNPFCDRLGEAADIEINSVDELLKALKKRHDDFHAVGCRLSDHGMKHCPSAPCSEKDAAAIFHNARSDLDVNVSDVDQFTAYIMQHLARWNSERGWTMQLHLAPVRNPNSRYFSQVGPDSGFDTIGDWPQGEALLRFLDLLDGVKALPKTILYNLNPRDNALFAAACGSFQEGPTPAKIQWGSAWWYNDTLRGMTDQIQTLASIGLLPRFVGMLTDSRSFLSYPRHEYFRRLLCNLIATDVENGEIPDDRDLLDSLIRGICYENAKAYFTFPHHDC